MSHHPIATCGRGLGPQDGRARRPAGGQRFDASQSLMGVGGVVVVGGDSIGVGTVVGTVGSG